MEEHLPIISSVYEVQHKMRDLTSLIKSIVSRILGEM